MSDGLPASFIVTPESWTRELPLEGLFGDRKPLEVDVGCGKGRFLTAKARKQPDRNFLGIDRLLVRLRKVDRKLTRHTLTNVRLLRIEAAYAVQHLLPPDSVSVFYILFPDPWPKRRHHRRRFVTAEFLAPLARVLAPGAEFRVATDIPDYVRQTLEEVPRHGFDWLAEGPGDWRRPWDDWLPTRYERKALREGRAPHYLTFRRR